MAGARRYVIRGRVQGVGFRWFTERRAVEIGIRGWVRNLGDGSVEIHAEGAADAIRQFEDALRVGPPSARVDNVQVTDAAALDTVAGFSVR